MNAINSPGLCPDPMPDDIQDELTQLRARVKELESDSITHLGIIGEKESRIRELEQAMPDVDSLRGMVVVATYTTKDTYLAMSLEAMADRIEKVMRKEGNE